MNKNLQGTKTILTKKLGFVNEKLLSAALTAEQKTALEKTKTDIDTMLAEIEASWIVKNSTLTAEEVMSAPLLSELKEEIQSILNGYLIGCTAFNNSFDFGFLENRGFVFGKKLPCPMKISTNICKIPGLRGFKWPNVEQAYKFFYPETNFIEKHRGADDAYHEADIVYALIQKDEFFNK